ncbi:MAG: hypothetical protein ABSD68_04225 [Candidatus Micrarchaeales archaeon]|jgi:hypothetical protein
MIRKFLYLGILLFIFGIVSAFMAISSIIPSQFSTPNYKQLVINSSSMKYLEFPLNQTGVVEILFNSNSPVNFYFTNATAFGKISALGAAPSSIGSLASSLKGNGVYEIYQNSTSGEFPYISYGNSTPSYVSNETALLNASTYYAIFTYSGSASANVQLSSMSIPFSALKSGLETTGIYGGIAIVLVLAGIVLIILSIFMKPKQPAQDKIDEEAKKEYESIEKKNRSSKKGST